MADWKTAFNLVITDTHRGNRDSDIDRAKVAIAHAIRRYHSTPFYFNEMTWATKVVKGIQSYSRTGATGLALDDAVQSLPPNDQLDAAVPRDLEAPLQVYVQNTGITWTPLKHVTHKEMRWYTYNEGTLGYPSIYSWWAEQMFYYSIPNREFAVRIDGIEKMETPQVLFEGDRFRVVIEDPADANNVIDVPDDWTNKFLLNAMDLITSKAKWEIYSQYHDDLENAQKADAMVEDALSRLRRKSEGRDAELRLMPIDMSTSDMYTSWD